MSFQPIVRAARADRKHKREKEALQAKLDKIAEQRKAPPSVMYRTIKEKCPHCGWITTKVVKTTTENYLCSCCKLHVQISKPRRVSLPKRIVRFFKSLGVPVPDRVTRSRPR